METNFGQLSVEMWPNFGQVMVELTIFCVESGQIFGNLMFKSGLMLGYG
jgi:hypothetical protein